MVTFGGLYRSPKVTTVLQRRALTMNPRYIFVVSYQISSNMVASATAPSPLEKLVRVFAVFVSVSWSLRGCARVGCLFDLQVTSSCFVFVFCLHPKPSPQDVARKSIFLVS